MSKKKTEVEKNKGSEATSENKKNLLEIDFSGIDNAEPLNEDEEKRRIEEERKERRRQRRNERRRERTKKAQEVMSDVATKTGVKLTVREAKFIDEYTLHGNQRQAAIAAGYAPEGSGNNAGRYAQKILGRDYIKAEIEARLKEHKESHIATREEIMKFFSDMMNGKILDQFDMPTSNSDKIKAGIELAKRTIDVEDRIKEKREATRDATSEIKISLSWENEDEPKE